MYQITLKNVKKSVQNFSLFLKEKGFDIPHTTLLHAFSKALFFQNWNTLKAKLDGPQSFEPYHNYVLQFSSKDISPEQFFDLFLFYTEKADCLVEVSQKRYFENGLEITFTNPNNKKGYSNLLTTFMMLTDVIKKQGHSVAEFKCWNTRVECQDWSQALLNTNAVQKIKNR